MDADRLMGERLLVCTAPEGKVASFSTVSLTLPSGKIYKIIEDCALVPIDLQEFYISSRTAELLVDKSPEDWLIVDQRDVAELERMYAL